MITTFFSKQKDSIMDNLITATDYEGYIIAYIAYIDRKEPHNFVVVFYNMDDGTLPVVRSLVKRKETSVTAKVATTDTQIKITKHAEDRFKSESIRVVSLLYRTDKEQKDEET